MSSSYFEMTNLRRQESGLPYDIWLDSSGHLRKTRHSHFRIKVSVDNMLIPVVIKSMEEIKPLKPFKGSAKIISWIRDNYEILFSHWNGELSDIQALSMLSIG